MSDNKFHYKQLIEIDHEFSHHLALLATVQAQLQMAIRLLNVAKCPECDGSGAIPVQVSDDEWRAQQCQWCFERNMFISQLPEVKK